MGFRIAGDTAALTQAINTFNAQYHRDYFSVRRHAAAYLAGSPALPHAQQLAVHLSGALESWGAGKRLAPSCRTVDAAAQALCNPALHARLQELAQSFPYLEVIERKRHLKEGAPFPTVEQFDRALIAALGMLADALLVNNTNVTYPMKALLLITGLMPAYDSQVKGGLAIAGVAGINKTRYLLPTGNGADTMKICVLPFHIAESVKHSRVLFDTAIENSLYPELKGEYGRLFDILFFMQHGRCKKTALIEFCAPTPLRRWYDM